MMIRAERHVRKVSKTFKITFQLKMGLMTWQYYEDVQDYLHPSMHTFIDYYRSGKICCHFTAVVFTIEMEVENMYDMK